MKKNPIVTAILVLVLSMAGLAGCGGGEGEAKTTEIVEVERGDLATTVTADGNLEMPREAQLRFGTPGTVEQIFVEEGDKVKEGTLLAKLDQTGHKIQLAQAQYELEVAMNDLVQKIQPALMGYPEFYPDTSAILRVEQAQEELEEAEELLGEGSYQQAASELRLAQLDLEASYGMLNIPLIEAASAYHDELGQVHNRYPQIPEAIELLEQDLERLAGVQTLMEGGSYDEAIAELQAAQRCVEDTHRLVKSVSGRIRVSQRIGECGQQRAGQRAGATGLQPISYPDTCTSLDWLRQVEEELENVQVLVQRGECDNLELAEALRMAQHEVEMSRTVLEEDELIFRGGLNLQALRAANLNIQIAEKGVQSAKEELMKTEILSPFDGTVVDIGVKENDQLSSFDYSSVTAVYVVDTSIVEMKGVVDEIDIYQVELGQDVLITLDAVPDKEFEGEVAFIPPFGVETAGIVEFDITVELDPTEVELKGGLTATADVIVDSHEDVLLVPNRSVKGSPGEYRVEVVVDEATGETELRQVTLGAQNDRYSEVVSGLTEGEKLVVGETRGR